MSPDGSIIFTDSTTDGVFSISLSGEVREIIHGDPKLRFADFSVHPLDSNWILAVQEDHRGADVLNTLVAIDSQAKTIHPISQRADFYSHPRFSYDGKRICWMHWNHPDMPWMGSELFVAEWKNGESVEGRYISGKPKFVSVCHRISSALSLTDLRMLKLGLERFTWEGKYSHCCAMVGF